MTGFRNPTKVDAFSLFRFYRSAYLAVTDFRSYRSILRQPLPQTFVYLLYLSANLALIYTIALAWLQLPAAYDLIHWARDNFPPMQIREGQLQVEGEQPVTREYLGQEVYTFVFDSTGQHEPLHRVRTPAVVFTRDNLFVMRQDQTHTWSWKQLHQVVGISVPVVLGKEQWDSFERWLPWLYFPLLYSFLLLTALVAKSVQSIFLTFFALFASARQGVRLPFSDYFTIALYSLTPAAAIDVIIMASQQDSVFLELIPLATAAIYTYLATQRCLSLE